MDLHGRNVGSYPALRARAAGSKSPNKMMKQLTLIICALIGLVVSSFAAGGFDQGFEARWEAGRHFAHGPYSIVPICPIPPIQTINEENTFQDGCYRN